VTIPLTPARRAVASASPISFAAPWAEATFPRRNRVPAITGAVIGVDRVASWALSPLTRE